MKKHGIETMGKNSPFTDRIFLFFCFSIFLSFGLFGCTHNSSDLVFDLGAANIENIKLKFTNITIEEPQALQFIDSNRILIKKEDGSLAYISDVKWADRIPKLIQAKLVQTFQNAQSNISVGKVGEGFIPSIRLVSDLRYFGIIEVDHTAKIEISVKLIREKDGNIIAGKIFSSSTNLKSSDSEFASSLNLASMEILREIVIWTSKVI